MYNYDSYRTTRKVKESQSGPLLGRCKLKNNNVCDLKKYSYM